MKRGERTTVPLRTKAVKPVPKAKVPYSEYYHPDHVKQREEIVAMARADAVWKCEGFASMVIDKGFGAYGPDDYRGNKRSWQTIGRKLFGEATFNEAVKKELEKRRDSRGGSGSPSSSSSPSSLSSADSSLPPVTSSSLF